MLGAAVGVAGEQPERISANRQKTNSGYWKYLRRLYMVSSKGFKKGWIWYFVISSKGLEISSYKNHLLFYSHKLLVATIVASIAYQAK
jgi:hypothetical protein